MADAIAQHDRQMDRQERFVENDFPRQYRWVVLAVFLLYLLLPTKNYYWDGVGFSLTIENSPFGPALFHPNHLLYNPLGYLLWSAVRAVAPGVRVLVVLQYTNIVLAAACVWLLQSLLWRITRSPYLTVTLSLLFALSGTFWKYATDADAYILSILCLLLCFRTLVMKPEPRPVRAGLWHASAMLVHQIAVIFFPVAVVSLYRKGGMRAVVRYAAIAGSTLPLYYAAYWLGHPHPRLREFRRWMTSFDSQVSFTFSPGYNLTKSLESYVGLFFQARAALLRQFFSAVYAVLLVLLGGAVLALLIQGFRYRRESRLADGISEIKAQGRLPLVWLGAYMVFLFFWLPQQRFYKLFCLPAIVLLAAHLLSRYTGKRHYRLALFTAVMALSNLTFCILPLSRPEATPALALAQRMHPLWPQGTTVYYTDYRTSNWFLRYFNPQTAWKSLDPRNAAADFRREANSAFQQGHDVWIEDSAEQSLAHAQGDQIPHCELRQEAMEARKPIRLLRCRPIGGGVGQ